MPVVGDERGDTEHAPPQPRGQLRGMPGASYPVTASWAGTAPPRWSAAGLPDVGIGQVLEVVAQVTESRAVRWVRGRRATVGAPGR
jgi:hypothetical protein